MTFHAHRHVSKKCFVSWEDDSVGRGPAMGGPESDTQCLHLKQNLGILYTLTITALERQDRRILGSQGQQPSLISEPWAGMSLKTRVDKC